MTYRPNPPEADRATREWYGTTDPKKIKRIERRIFGHDEIYQAYQAGDDSRWTGRPNPYPPGRRHAEFERAATIDDRRA